MNCHSIQSLISAYIDCELSGLEMLAIRQHLSECDECEAEYESFVRVKRVFGSLPEIHPLDGLADRICHRLDDLSTPAHEHAFTALRKHVSFFPGNLKLAAAGIAVFGVLLMLRTGQMYNGSYGYTSASQPVQTVRWANQPEGVRLFPASTMVRASALEPLYGRWELPGLAKPEENTGAPGGLLPISFGATGQ